MQNQNTSQNCESKLKRVKLSDFLQMVSFGNISQGLNLCDTIFEQLWENHTKFNVANHNYVVKLFTHLH